MTLVVNQVRRAEKITATALLAPTVAPSTDHTDGSWISTDIYPGEMFVNITDRRIWTSDGVSVYSLNRINLTELDDFPANYTGQALKYVRVNAGETGVEFATGTATGLNAVLAVSPLTGGANIDVSNGDLIRGSLGSASGKSSINMRQNAIDNQIRIINDDVSITDYSLLDLNIGTLHLRTSDASNVSVLSINGQDGFQFSSSTGIIKSNVAYYFGSGVPTATSLETQGTTDTNVLNTRLANNSGTKYINFYNDGKIHAVSKMQLGERTTFDNQEGLNIDQAGTANRFLTLGNNTTTWMLVDQYAKTKIGNLATTIAGVSYVDIVSKGGAGNYNNALAVNQALVSTVTEAAVAVYAKSDAASTLFPNIGLYATALNHASSSNIAIHSDGVIHINLPVNTSPLNANSIRARGSNTSSLTINARIEGSSGLTSDSFVVSNSGSIGIRNASPVSTAYVEIGDGVTSNAPVMRMLKGGAQTAQFYILSGGAQGFQLEFDASEDVYLRNVVASRHMYFNTNNTNYVKLDGANNHIQLLKTNGGLIMNNVTTGVRTGLSGEGLALYDTDEDIFYGYGDGKWNALGNFPSFSVSNNAVVQVFGAGPTKHTWAAGANYNRKSSDYTLTGGTDFTLNSPGVWEINVSLSLQSTGGATTSWRMEVFGASFLIGRQDFTLSLANEFHPVNVSSILDTVTNGNTFYVQITRLSGASGCRQSSFNSWVTAKRII